VQKLLHAAKRMKMRRDPTGAAQRPARRLTGDFANP
jgi:hypothetical protein